MRRPPRIVLALMGGGLVLSGCDSRECREARAQHRPDADELCRTGSTGGHSGGGGGTAGRSSVRSGGSSSAGASADSAASRGGFGAAGHASMGE